MCIAGRSAQALSSAYFGQASGPVWLHDLNCTGSERHVSQCEKGNWGGTNCSHTKDAGVRCQQGKGKEAKINLTADKRHIVINLFYVLRALFALNAISSRKLV